ncbi:hypothetical protein [Fibrella arboris]|uniref:hypothetical protein n=1 Tax=Fibrella arboris TaxID=3242486 RepID=UPI0035203224
MRVAQINKQQTVVTTLDVLDGYAAIVTILVNHLDELQFLGSAGLSPATARVTTFEHILALDPFLRKFERFETNTRYERTPSGHWTALP